MPKINDQWREAVEASHRQPFQPLLPNEEVDLSKVTIEVTDSTNIDFVFPAEILVPSPLLRWAEQQILEMFMGQVITPSLFKAIQIWLDQWIKEASKEGLLFRNPFAYLEVEDV